MDHHHGTLDGTLDDIVVANLHKRFTGVSRTVAELVPHQRQRQGITLMDSGNLGLGGRLGFWSILRQGWSRPTKGRYRVFHARRDVEMIVGLLLGRVPLQKWKVMFTSAAPKRPNGFLRFLINRMDAVVATSSRSADFLPWTTTIIGHGVDTQAFRPAENREDALREVGLEGHLVIGAFGRVRPSKGTDLLVQALLDVLPKHKDVVCVISGLIQEKDSAYHAKMVGAIKAAGLADRIRFLGDQSDADIKRWYQRIGLCVAASRTEGYGLTPLEAFASGAAAVTSGAGVWPQVMTPEIGRMFETGNATALAETLEKALADRDALAEMGRRAREAAEERFSISAEVEGLQRLYEKLQNNEHIERIRSS